MSRLNMITIGIVVVCLAALGYLVYKIVNLMNPPAETTSIADTYTDQSAVDDSTYTADNWDDEVSGNEAQADLDDDELAYNSTDDEADAGAGSYSEETADDVEEDAGSKLERDNFGSSGSATTSSGSVASRNTGRFMVIAGSYQQRSNADNQAAKLRRLGYEAARVEIFDRGSYAVVLVDRFSRLSEANQLVRKLAGDGIESFVKERN